MQIIYRLTKPYEDLYLEYTGTREITGATSDEMNTKMRKVMADRGYIMTKCGRRAYHIHGDTAFNCLTWCIEQSISDLGTLLNGVITQLIAPYNGKSMWSGKDKYFLVDVNVPAEKSETYLLGIKNLIEEAEGKLLRSKLSVTLEYQAALA